MSLSKYFTLALAMPLAFSLPVEAQKKKRAKKKTHSSRAKALTPEEQLKTFKLPEGFKIELVASEKNGLMNPIDLAFDDAGRLWTNTAVMYPLDPNTKLVGRKSLDALDKGTIGQKGEFKRISDLYKLKTRGKDKVLVIADPTKEVKGQIHVFADGMAIPQSFLPYKNGVFVAHGSEMLYLEDKNGDGKADGHETVLTGFGFTDSHTMSHTLVRGPGGWVHFSHGALNKGKVVAPKSGNSTQINFSKIARFSLDGENVEVVNNGLQNIWGFHLKANGQWYGTEANDLFYSLVPMHPMMGYKGIGNDRIRPYQPFPVEFHNFKVNGTGISGLTYDENGKSGFPDEWKDVGFLANPITSTINSVVADRNPDGSVISKHLPDFLSCSDDWFRPVNIEFGPDGCLYVVDWYNKIVSHNEVSRDHPERDRSHGRIWRISHESQKKAPIPNVTKASDEDLLKHLRAEILWEKRAAWHQIADRGATSLVPELSKMVTSASETLETRILALWSLESLGTFDLEIMKSLAADENADIRREAIRSLNTFKPGLEDLVSLTKPLINDPHYMVKEQVLRTLAAVKAANSETIGMLVSSANPEAPGKNTFGANYENNFQRFLALMALEQYPSELMAFLDSPAAGKLPTANLTEATQVLPKAERADNIIAAIKAGKTKLDGNTLVALSESMSDPKVLAALKGQLSSKEFVQLALDNQERLRSGSLLKALEPALKELVAMPEEQSFAVGAAIRFQSPAINKELLKLIGAKSLSEVSSQLIDALAISPNANAAELEKIASDTSVKTGQKVQALLRLAVVKPKEAGAMFVKLYKDGDDGAKSSLVNSVVRSESGGVFILELISKKMIDPKTLELTDLQRIVESHRKNPLVKNITKFVKLAEVKKEEEGEAKVKTFLNAVKTLKGDPVAGKGHFMQCTLCHQVGDIKREIAPSLDGSKNRDIHHLLVAIIKPNDAMEGGYKLYRVTKKNGEILEGYNYSTTQYGTTLAVMGETKIYIPKEQIKSERFVNGISFMPSNFGEMYDDQAMADLISYMKTIE